MGAASKLMEYKAEITFLHGMSRLRPAIVADDQCVPVPAFTAEKVYGLPLSLIAEILADDCFYRYHIRKELDAASISCRIRFTTSTAFPFHWASI